MKEALLTTKAFITTAIVLGLAITNPSKENYSDFISQHIKRTVCDQTEMPQTLKSLCSMVTRPITKTMIRESTDRTNLILASYYHTDILGVLEVKTIGIGGFLIVLPTDH